MVCAAPEYIESICDKFHDAYERQPNHMQRKYFSRQLMIGAPLYGCYKSVKSPCDSYDCHSKMMLNSILSMDSDGLSRKHDRGRNQNRDRCYNHPHKVT